MVRDAVIVRPKRPSGCPPASWPPSGAFRPAWLLLFTLGVLALLTPPAAAQLIQGVVFDRGASRPLAGARITLFTPAFEPVDSTVSDPIGRFRFPLERAGSYVLLASEPRYLASAPEAVEVAEGATAVVMLGLEPLPGVQVRSRERAGGAATAYLFGRVVDRDTGEPVEGAEVRLTTPSGTRSLLTRWDGRFRVADMPPGPLHLQVEHLAYGAQEKRLSVEPGVAYEFTVKLVEEPIVLEGITVRVHSRPMAGILKGVYERMDRGLGYFLTRDELEAMGSMPVAYAIDRLPRTEIRRIPGGFRVRLRTCIGKIPALFVDGALVFRPDEEERDRWGEGQASEFYTLTTSEIEAIEVYSSRATLPAEFMYSGVRCAIAIWTRRGG